MPIKTVTSAQILAGGKDISGFTGTITEVPGAKTMREATTFGTRGFKAWRPGFRAGSYGLSGFTDHDSTTGIGSMLTPSNLGATQAVSIAVPASGADIAVADWCEFGEGVLQNWSPLKAPVDDLMQFDAMWATSGPFVSSGRVAAPLASRGTSGLTGAAVAMAGPAAGQRMYALLDVHTALGTNLAVKLQSDDNSGFTTATDRITFSTVSAAGYQLASVAGDLSTETYWRAVATIASVTFVFAVYFGVA